MSVSASASASVSAWPEPTHAKPGAGPLAEPVNRAELSQLSRPGSGEQVVIPYMYAIDV